MNRFSIAAGLFAVAMFLVGAPKTLAQDTVPTWDETTIQVVLDEVSNSYASGVAYLTGGVDDSTTILVEMTNPTSGFNLVLFAGTCDTTGKVSAEVYDEVVNGSWFDVPFALSTLQGRYAISITVGGYNVACGEIPATLEFATESPVEADDAVCRGCEGYIRHYIRNDSDEVIVVILEDPTKACDGVILVDPGVNVLVDYQSGLTRVEVPQEDTPLYGHCIAVFWIGQ